VGSGLIGHLPVSISETDFLQQLKTVFGLQVVRHTPLRNKIVSTVALCGGSGSFLIKRAIAAKADIYVTGDVKYHEFFDAENKLVIADIGHWESEQFTPYIIIDFLRTKFPTFAVLKSNVNTNPVQYFS
jgi:putative NIF3 family GTP cyclohydrolase 1 type 2